MCVFFFFSFLVKELRSKYKFREVERGTVTEPGQKVYRRDNGVNVNITHMYTSDGPTVVVVLLQLKPYATFSAPNSKHTQSIQQLKWQKIETKNQILKRVNIVPTAQISPKNYTLQV